MTRLRKSLARILQEAVYRVDPSRRPKIGRPLGSRNRRKVDSVPLDVANARIDEVVGAPDPVAVAQCQELLTLAVELDGRPQTFEDHEQ